jgi:hypothetical protein
MIKKIDILKDLMVNGSTEKAICYAAKFPRLGKHDKAIKQAAGAINNPSFYSQIGKEPDKLIEQGYKALIDRYQ